MSGVDLFLLVWDSQRSGNNNSKELLTCLSCPLRTLVRVVAIKHGLHRYCVDGHSSLRKEVESVAESLVVENRKAVSATAQGAGGSCPLFLL